MISKTRQLLRGERGEGKIGAIIALIVVAVIGHSLYVFIPFKVQTAEFEKHCEEQLEKLAAQLKKEDDFRLSILEKAGSMELPVTEDQIFVELVGDTYKFKTQYEMTLPMIWGPMTQKVEIKRERTRL